MIFNLIEKYWLRDVTYSYGFLSPACCGRGQAMAIAKATRNSQEGVWVLAKWPTDYQLQPRHPRWYIQKALLGR